MLHPNDNIYGIFTEKMDLFTKDFWFDLKIFDYTVQISVCGVCGSIASAAEYFQSEPDTDTDLANVIFQESTSYFSLSLEHVCEFMRECDSEYLQKKIKETS